MSGLTLFLLALCGAIGAIAFGLMGAFKAMGQGEKWTWWKFGESCIAALISGAGVSVTMWQAGDINTGVAFVLAFFSGLGVSAGISKASVVTFKSGSG